MHTKHEGKEVGTISMIITQGLFLIGNLVGGNKLLEPRVFTFIEEGAKIQLSPLPSLPPFVTFGNEVIKYSVPEKDRNLLSLYDRVTHPQPEGVMGTAGPRLVQ